MIREVLFLMKEIYLELVLLISEKILVLSCSHTQEQFL